jgi:hypothetical protein
VAEQAADAVGVAFALPSRVDHERLLPSATEHQRGAQAGGTRADDDAVPSVLHAAMVAHHTLACQTDLP